MAPGIIHSCTFKSRLQHHILNWIVISRYQLVQRGVSKSATLRSLLLVEHLLKKIHLIT